MGPFIPVGKHLEGLSDVLELGLCGFAVFLVFVGVPSGSEFLIGALDLEEGGILRDSEDGIVVFEGGFGGHWGRFVCF